MSAAASLSAPDSGSLFLDERNAAIFMLKTAETDWLSTKLLQALFFGRPMHRPILLSARDAAKVLGISYPTLKQWIYKRKLRTVKTAGGHHRIPELELDKFLPTIPGHRTVAKRRRNFRRISGRNQLAGRLTDIKISGLMAQVRLSIGGQQITSIITTDAAVEMLKVGEKSAALIKSTEVMIVRP